MIVRQIDSTYKQLYLFFDVLGLLFPKNLGYMCVDRVNDGVEGAGNFEDWGESM